MWPCLAFYLGGGHLNSDPHDVLWTLFPAEPPPQPGKGFCGIPIKAEELASGDQDTAENAFTTGFFLSPFVRLKG